MGYYTSGSMKLTITDLAAGVELLNQAVKECEGRYTSLYGNGDLTVADFIECLEDDLQDPDVLDIGKRTQGTLIVDSLRIESHYDGKVYELIPSLEAMQSVIADEGYITFDGEDPDDRGAVYFRNGEARTAYARVPTIDETFAS